MSQTTREETVTMMVDKDSLLWKAWQSYAASGEYKNSCKWASKSKKYIKGSMWAAFSAGFAAEVLRESAPAAAPASEPKCICPYGRQGALGEGNCPVHDRVKA